MVKSMKKSILMILFILSSTCVYGEDYNIEQIEFIGHSDRLSGSIAFPKDGKIHSAVVFVHGSGKQERNTHWAKRFA